MSHLSVRSSCDFRKAPIPLVYTLITEITSHGIERPRKLGPKRNGEMDMKLDLIGKPTPQLASAEIRPAPALTGIELVENESAELSETWQHVVDGLSEQIALVDENWTMLVVNQSWAKIAELYGHFALVPGTNYLHFCREMTEGGLEVARDVVAGIERIDAGKCNSFELFYRASQPEVGNAYRLCINRFEAKGRKLATITRYDITRVIELRELRENFSHSMIVGQAEERLRMGRELHDSTMQLMACLNMKVGQLRRATVIEETSPILDEMDELLAETQQEIRSISYLAHPPLLGKLTLPEALKALIEGFGRRTGLNVEFETLGDPHACCPAAEGAIYRIVQEALSNIHRHSRARRAKVRLSGTNGAMHAVIADDGIGMPSVITSGVGLGGMRSRLSELGGRLSIRSKAPGTAVIATVPAQLRSVR